MAKIGSKVQETRLRKGLTLDRIADDTNISVRFLSKIENDEFTGSPASRMSSDMIRIMPSILATIPTVVARTEQATNPRHRQRSIR